MLSSKASDKNGHGQNSSYFLGWEEYERNPYDPVSNPEGMIQMGVAENQLCFDLLESWMENNPDATGFKSKDGQNMLRELALFQDYNGLPRFKKAMSEFMGKIRGNRVKFNPDNLVLTAGATCANEILMFCLADPGDAFLVPTPYYPGFDRDLKWRTGAEIVPIKCTSNNGFRITKSALQESLLSAQKSGLRVKGILVTNPSNPLGTTLTLSEITLLLSFISTHSLHLIADEIYAGTVFTTTSTFTSFIFYHNNDSLRWPGWDWDQLISKRVHLVTSLSKDMGLPGFRIGAIYTLNPDVHSAATKMSSFGLMSSATQHLMAVMLSDRDFITLYVEENKIRLRRRREILVRGLERVGVGCLQSDAGLFCWVDMRGLLLAIVTSGGGGGITSLEDAEVELWRKFTYEVRINVSPGGSCHCAEPGWFRFCFANLDEEALRLAVQRIQGFVLKLSRKRSGGRLLNFNGLRAGSGCRRQQSLPTSLTTNKWVSRLSLDDRDPDDR